MSRQYPHNVYLFCGSIYDMNGCIIENPALLLDKSDGCVHGYGNADFVNEKFMKMATTYNQNGLKGMADDLLLMDFSNAYYKGVSNEEICYILRRAVEYTATSFQTALCEHAVKPDFKEWLKAEMTRVPINLEEQYFTT